MEVVEQPSAADTQIKKLNWSYIHMHMKHSHHSKQC